MTTSALPLQNVNAGRGTRHERGDNKYGLKGLDHFALPTLDVDGLYAFMKEVLGGEPYIVAGYDEIDRQRGRAKHVFMRVGNVLAQFATPADDKVRCGRDDPNPWPHWAFTVSAEDLERNVERLRSLGIPAFGPVSHRGEYGAAAYFATPEGHKLELKTYDDYPEEKLLGEMGAPGVGFTDWSTLYHDWRNAPIEAQNRPAISLENVDAGHGTRQERDDNRYGLKGLDHFALPTLDVDGLYVFIKEVLGGEPFIVVGYEEDDRQKGRAKHVFMRVGTVLAQLAAPIDGKVRCGREDPNGWPHWAFTVSAEDLERNVERLLSLGIPVFGPVTHRGTYGAAAYFATPEGHKLELKTYDEYPEEKLVGEMGAPGVGFIDWSTLYHDWPNTISAAQEA